MCARAQRHGPRDAYVFLAEGERETSSLSYGRLAVEVRRLARHLAAEAGRGERALLVYPPGLEFVVAFLACLEAGVVAVPVHPPRPRAGLGSLGTFAADAEPRLLLGTAGQLDRLRRAAGEELHPALAAARWLATALEEDGPGAGSDRAAPEPGWTPPAVAGGDLAFLQYTSGSTAAPKGVMVSHDNLAANQAAIEASFRMSEESVVVSWLPPYHDMGLIGTVLQPLWCGGTAVLMSPLSFLQRPRRWLEAVTRYRATTTGGPDFAYALTARRVGEEERAGLDLSSLTVAFSGAEPVRPGTLDRFHHAFAGCGFRREAFYPCYGLAEATLFVSGGRVGEVPKTLEVETPAGDGGQGETAPRRLTGCGAAWSGEVIAITDPETGRPQPPGAEGEIRVAGPSVARGYWRRPELTRETFRRAIEPGGEPYLRTGDLGFLDEAGELYVSGRLKDLIVVRGRNLYPQDLEAAAEAAHPAVRMAGAAAFAVEVAGEERVVVALEVERREEAAAGDAVEAVCQALVTSHGVAAHTVVALRAGSLPRTTSGKVRRQPCRRAWLAGELEPLARVGEGAVGEAAGSSVGEPDQPLPSQPPAGSTPPGDGDLPARVRQAVAAVTGSAPSEGGELTADLPAGGAAGRLHLDSLQAVEVSHRLQRHGAPPPPLSLLLSNPTVAEVAAWLASGGGEGRESAGAGGAELRPVPMPAGSRHPLADGQRALLLAERMGEAGRQAVLACAVRLGRRDGVPLSADRVEAALLALARRHPVLRIAFPVDGDEPVQQVTHSQDTAPQADFAAVDAAGWGEDELRAALERAASAPFDLAAGPPWRARWWHGGAAGEGGRGLLLLAIHHAAADFASLDLLLAELMRELAGGAAGSVPDSGDAAGEPAAGVTYASFVAWQRRWTESPAGRRAGEFWRAELAGLPAALGLPTDRPRPPVASRQGAARSLRLDADAVASLHAAARRAGTTPFSWMAAVWQAVLGRWTGAADFAVATAVAGRPTRSLSGVAGHFVNLLPLRSDLGAGGAAARWDGLAAATGRRLATALDHQHLPFPRLVEAVAPPRDPSRHPLAQAGLVMESPRRLTRLAAAPGGTPDAASSIAALVLGEAAPPFVLGGMEVEPVALPRRTAELDLLLMLVEEGEPGAAGSAGAGTAVALEYATALFDAATAERLLAWYANALAASLAAPERRWADAPLLSEQERRQVAAAQVGPAPRAALPVHRAFSGHARRAPDAPAVIWLAPGTGGGESAVVETLSYGELAQRVDTVARHLVAAGVGPEDRVGVLVDRTPARVVALLAVLRAGGCFLALDPADPPARHAELLTAAGAGHLVTGRAGPPAAGGGVTLHLDAVGRPAGTWPTPGVELPDTAGDHPESAAYLVYTSGSTGAPKGVVIPHRAIAALAAEAADVRRLGPGARQIHLAALTFDISLGEILLPLATGAAVALAGEDARRSGVALARQLRLLGATHVVTTPSILALVAPGEEPAALRDVIVGGEVCPPEVAERWVPLLAARGGALRNGYGPAETTVHSTLSSCPPGAAAEIRYLGRPNAGTRLRLEDRHGGQPLPGGGGEILIAGAGLARGYLGRPAATAERFTPDPEAGRGGVAAGSRVYRSGDLGRLGKGGEITFAGRLDRQLKVRGVRIEPVEVEVALTAHPRVSAAAVDARGERLVAWVVTAGGDGEGGAVAAARPLVGDEAGELRRHLEERLPRGMVPDRFLALRRLPVTANGKVDLAALPWAPPRRAGAGPMEADSTVTPGSSAPAATERELAALVARLWAEELGLEQVPPEATFFDLGGHSLALARIHQRLSRALGREISLPDLFSHATVSSLAAHLAAGGEGAAGTGEAPPAGRAADAGSRASTRRDAMRRLRRRRAGPEDPDAGPETAPEPGPDADPDTGTKATEQHRQPATAGAEP